MRCGFNAKKKLKNFAIMVKFLNQLNSIALAQKTWFKHELGLKTEDYIVLRILEMS